MGIHEPTVAELRSFLDTNYILFAQTTTKAGLTVRLEFNAYSVMKVSTPEETPYYGTSLAEAIAAYIDAQKETT